MSKHVIAPAELTGAKLSRIVRQHIKCVEFLKSLVNGLHFLIRYFVEISRLVLGSHTIILRLAASIIV